MKHISFFVVLTFFFNTTIAHDNSSHKHFSSPSARLFSQFNMLHAGDFSIEKLAGNFVLAKRKTDNKDDLLIQSATYENVVEKNKKIQIFSGGPNHFAWKTDEENKLCIFNTETSQLSKHHQTKSDTIYDVFNNNNKTFIYGYNKKKRKEFIRCPGQQRNYFSKINRYRMLNDHFTQYKSDNTKYSLITATEPSSSYVLIQENPHHILGIFNSFQTYNNIAISSEGQQYAFYFYPYFLLYNYKHQNNSLYLDSSIPKPTAGFQLSFASTDDVILAYYDNFLIIISFAHLKHWQLEMQGLQKILPCFNIRKTVFQYADGSFKYLNYNSSTDSFEALPYDD